MALSEDLKYKLTQLEEEISRYRSENTSLERLRKDREDVSERESPQAVEAVEFTVFYVVCRLLLTCGKK